MGTSKISILVVEDDKFISVAYQAKFESEGFKCEYAFNGEEALEILKNYTPDIIILDIIMPLKNGFEVLDFLKKNKRLASVPVIVATNLGQEQHILKAMQMGAREYIVKSELSLNSLVEKIKTMI